MTEPLRSVAFSVNGTAVEITVRARTLLSDALRHELLLTGTHVGCEHGHCGACTVLVDGEPVRSCLLLAPQVESCTVETIESVAEGPAVDQLDAVQRALHEHHGLQCGFCTPGLVMSLVAARRRGAGLDEVLDDVLSGHLCRCTGYVNIRAAVRSLWAS